LDEPFGALDASVRKDLRQWLRHLHQELNVTSIFVTHDQEEAMEVASQVVVLNHGRIEQQGIPSDIYDHPVNEFVSKFIGQTNIFHIEKEDSQWLQHAGIVLDDPQGMVAHVRPHDIQIEKAESAEQSPIILKDWQHLGATIRLELAKTQAHFNSPNAVVYAQMPNEQFKALNLNKGDHVLLQIRQAHWFN
jgi:sulfate transport system ATP-binding protein